MTHRSAPVAARLALLALAACGVFAPRPALAWPYDTMISGGLYVPRSDLPNTGEYEVLLGSRLVNHTGIAGSAAGRHISSTDLLIPGRARSNSTLVPNERVPGANIDMLQMHANAYAVLGEDENNSAIFGLGSGYDLMLMDAAGFSSRRHYGGWTTTLWAGFRATWPTPLPFGIQVARHFGRLHRDGEDPVSHIPVKQELDATGWTVRLSLWITE